MSRKKAVSISLYQAAKAGDEEAVRELLSAGADVNAVQRGHETLFGFTEDSGTALMAAAGSGHTEVVRLLLGVGAKVRLKDKNGAGALLHATAPGHTEVVRLLLDAGADPNEKEAQGRSALSIAAWGGHEALVTILLERGADVKAGDASGVTPFHFAVRQRYLAIARSFLAAGAQVNAKDSSQQTPLHDAAQRLFLVPGGVGESKESPIHLDLVELLLDTGADVSARDMYGWTPLHRAVMDDRVETARRLIARGADVNARSGNDSYPLMMASDHLEMTELLIQAGADVNAEDEDGKTALFLAVRHDARPVIRTLVAAGADINHLASRKRSVLDEPVEDGNTALFDFLLSLGAVDAGGGRIGKMSAVALRKAAEEGKTQRVRELLKMGVPPDGREKQGLAALWQAADKGHLTIVRLLLKAGADPDLPGAYDSRAIHRAVATGKLKLVQGLIDAGAEVNVAYEREWGEGYKGWTPLMEAAETGSLEITQALIAAGADCNAVTKNGYTPFLLAAQERHYEVADYLRTVEAKTDGVAKHFLEAQAFEQRITTPEITSALSDLTEICEVAPRITNDLPGAALFDIRNSPAYQRRREAVVAEIAGRLLNEGRFASEKEAREAAAFVAENQAGDQTIHGLVEQHQEAFLERGCYLLFVTGFAACLLALLPTTDPYAAIACLGPGPYGLPDMIRTLKKLHKEFPFRLRGCGGATLMLHFTETIADSETLAKKLFRFDSDERGVIVEGNLEMTDKKKELAAALARPDPIVRLWWD